MPARTAALSAICGTHFGLTKLVTSISRSPAACSRCTSSILTAGVDRLLLVLQAVARADVDERDAGRQHALVSLTLASSAGRSAGRRACAACSAARKRQSTQMTTISDDHARLPRTTKQQRPDAPTTARASTGTSAVAEQREGDVRERLGRGVGRGARRQLGGVAGRGERAADQRRRRRSSSAWSPPNTAPASAAPAGMRTKVWIASQTLSRPGILSTKNSMNSISAAGAEDDGL